MGSGGYALTLPIYCFLPNIHVNVQVQSEVPRKPSNMKRDVLHFLVLWRSAHSLWWTGLSVTVVKNGSTYIVWA